MKTQLKKYLLGFFLSTMLALSSLVFITRVEAATIVFSENFEGAFPGDNWLVGDGNPSSGEDYWDDTSYRSHGGSWSGWCSGVGDTAPSHVYDNNMYAYMVRKYVIDASGWDSAVLSFYAWYKTESGIDYCKVLVTGDAGSHWDEIDPMLSGDHEYWSKYSVTIPSAYLTNLFSVGFVFKSDGSGMYEGVYIDDITLERIIDSNEWIYYFELNHFDNDGDGYDDAAHVRLDVNTDDGTLDVTGWAYLYDPNGDLVDSDSSTWTITGTNIEYGDMYLYVPNGGLVGKYHIYVEVYDDLGNLEDETEGWIDPLYPPDYGKPPDLTVFDPEIDGLTVTVNGVVYPGTPGTSITRIHWNWGDGHSEDHWFPASHTYSSYDEYTITVTAYQSDGLTSSEIRRLYRLTISVSPSDGGTTNPSSGSYLCNDGESVTVGEEENPGYSFNHWDLDGSNVGSGTSYTVIMDASHTLTAFFEPVKHKLTVYSAHDSPVPGNGDHWYDHDEWVTCSVTSPVTEGSTVWNCTGWSGTGSVPSSGSGTSVTFQIKTDSSITWNWEGEAPKYTISLSSKTTDGLENIGTITFGGVTYTLPNSPQKEEGSYTALANPPGSYSFHHWEYTDGVSVSDKYANPTQVSVGGNGELKAVFFYNITLVFSVDESYYPVEGLSYDGDSNITNNYANYNEVLHGLRDLDQDGKKDVPAYLYKTVDGNYTVLEYWIYYAYDNKKIAGLPVWRHEHDFESVYLWVDSNYVITKISLSQNLWANNYWRAIPREIYIGVEEGGHSMLMLDINFETVKPDNSDLKPGLSGTFSGSSEKATLYPWKTYTGSPLDDGFGDSSNLMKARWETGPFPFLGTAHLDASIFFPLISIDFVNIGWNIYKSITDPILLKSSSPVDDWFCTSILYKYYITAPWVRREFGDAYLQSIRLSYSRWIVKKCANFLLGWASNGLKGFLLNFGVGFVAFKLPDLLGVINDPANLTIVDSEGNILGYKDGELVSEIPGGIIFAKSQNYEIYFISNNSTNFTYSILGQAPQTYNFTVIATWFNETVPDVPFNATNMPLEVASKHVYEMDWDALRQAKDGTIVNIDQNGDGVYEQTIQTGTTLTSDQIGGGYAYTDKSQYGEEETVTVGFQNTGSTAITLPTTAPWVILDASMNTVFRAIGETMLVDVSPGEKKEWQWNQKDDFGQQVPLGTYFFQIETSAGNFTARFSITTGGSWFLQWSYTYGGYGHSQFAQPIGDIDEDGVNEIIVGGYESLGNGRVRILSYDESTGTYVEEYSWTYTGGPYNAPSGACILDLDGDGDLEFVISWVYCGVHDGIYAYDWDGTTLTTLDKYNGTGFDFAFDVYAYDYDDDGDVEVLIANAPNMGAGVYHVTALGWDNINDKFTEETFWKLSGYEDTMECPMVWSGDTDNDGKTEVIVIISNGSYNTAGTWALNYNEASGEWEEEVVYTGYTDGTPYGVVVGDLDGDGIPEIGTGNNGGTDAYLFEWNGSGYEIVWHKNWPGEEDVIEAVAIGDADNDGINEFCVGTEDIHVIQWTGSEYIEESTITVTSGLLSGVNLGDCDTDGLNELKACDILDYGPGKEWILKYTRARVTNVTLSKHVVGQGYSLNINVTVQNRGSCSEAFNVTIYANTTIIATLTTVTLISGNYTTITFTWNTTGVPYGNYTLSATATPLPYETEATDNTYTYGIIKVTIPGDIDGDRVVDSTDQGILGTAWGSTIGEPNYDPDADLNGDGVVDSTDLGILGVNWGHSW